MTRPVLAAPTGRRSFAAQYPGNCASCGATLTPGDSIFYAPGNEGACGLDCCGDKEDSELVAVHRRVDDLAVDDEDPADAIARALPRGRTAKDACKHCWQIPAANGACGCSY